MDQRFAFQSRVSKSAKCAESNAFNSGKLLVRTNLKHALLARNSARQNSILRHEIGAKGLRFDMQLNKSLQTAMIAEIQVRVLQFLRRRTEKLSISTKRALESRKSKRKVHTVA